MKIKFIAPLLALLLAIGGCKKYEPQYDGPYSDADGGVAVKKPHEILYVSNGIVGLLNQLMTDVKILENAPAGVQKASINHTHDLIACWAPGQDVVVLDSNDVQVATIANSANVDWFDWHSNNQTLVLLQSGGLSFYGPNVEVANTELYNVFPLGSSERDIPAVVVGNDGTVYFTYRYYSVFNYEQFLRVQYPASTGLSDLSIQLSSYPIFDVMRATKDAQTMTICSTDPFNPTAYVYTPADNGFYNWGSPDGLVFSPDGLFTIYYDGYTIYNFTLNQLYFETGGPITALDW